jgi:hypothetical protein
VGRIAVETGLVIIGLMYVALSIWAIAGLFMRSGQRSPTRRGG